MNANVAPAGLASTLKQADQAAQQHSAQRGTGDPSQACPLLARYAIEVCVVGEDDGPLIDIAVELRQSESAVLVDKTDRNGAVRFEKLEAGSYQLCLPDLDTEAWELLASEGLGLEKGSCPGRADWMVPAPVVPAEEFKHAVVQGECTSKLADRYGFFPDTVWNWPANAALKALRRDKNILSPGDQLVIPARRRKSISVDAGALYTLRRLGVPELLRIRFLRHGRPRKRVEYLVSFVAIDGQIIADKAGVTDRNGMFVESVPPMITRADITLFSAHGEELHQFHIGHLDPIDMPDGVRKRLRNLGYACGPDSAEHDDALRKAVREFQTDRGLEVSGDIDDASRDKLRAIFRS